MIGSRNTALLHYNSPLFCVPKWPWALVSQVAVISFCKPSMNDYGKSCLQRFLFPLAFFHPPVCAFFFSFLFFLIFNSLFYPIPYSLTGCHNALLFPLLSLSLCQYNNVIFKRLKMSIFSTKNTNIKHLQKSKLHKQYHFRNTLGVAIHLNSTYKM